MNEIIDQLKVQFIVFGPNLLAGLAVLVLGWLVALIVSFLVRTLLGKTSLDNKLAAWISGPDATKPIPIEEWVGRGVFYLIMLFVLIAFFTTIKLTVITEPLNALVQPVIGYLPRLVGAGVLLLVAWVLATVSKKVIGGLLRATKLDEKLGSAATDGGKPMSLSDTFAQIVYWLVFLLFLPSILQALEMQALLEPVTALFTKIFIFLPNLISAAVILLIGWFIARIVQRLVQSLLVGVGVDKLGEK